MEQRPHDIEIVQEIEMAERPIGRADGTVNQCTDSVVTYRCKRCHQQGFIARRYASGPDLMARTLGLAPELWGRCPIPYSAPGPGDAAAGGVAARLRL